MRRGDSGRNRERVKVTEKQRNNKRETNRKRDRKREYVREDERELHVSGGSLS